MASPWITEAAAKLISHELASVGPVSVQILARMDEADFLNGSSHIVAFRRDTYPGHVRVVFRALPMLHGKMLVADRERIILGSANLTEGGLYRNHEISLHVDSRELGEGCAQEFFRLWSVAYPVADDYLATLEGALEDALPASDEEDPTALTARKLGRTNRAKHLTRFRYVSPAGASSARGLIMQTLRLPPPGTADHEEREAARLWLERTLRFLPSEERRSASVVQRLERLMYHLDTGVRATAVDRAGRSGNRLFLPRLQGLATNLSEPPEVRSAAVFALALLGSPESFSTLSALLAEPGNTGRWARRGSFLLMNDINVDGASWLLRELAVEDPAAVLALAKDCNVGQGTIAERLTKALLLEQYAMGRWSEEDVGLLVCVMAFSASAIQVRGKRLNIAAVAKHTADALGVAPGDLRHGPLSPSLLERVAASGVTDPGLAHLIGDIWVSIHQFPTSARDRLLSQERTRKVVQVVEA